MLTGSVLPVLVAALVSDAASDRTSPTLPEDIREILAAHCVDCHDGADASGGVDLVGAIDAPGLLDRCRTWNKAARVIGQTIMPPKDAEQPTEEERSQLVEWIHTTVRREAEEAPPDPGHSTLRRLNRVEYNHTIRDLLGIDIDASRDLPSDAAGNGFDNQGDTLFMPPVLMEKYLDTTKRLLNAAFEETNSRQQILRAEPNSSMSAADAARANLRPFLLRAFRRPPTEDEIDVRIELVATSMQRGRSFDEAMQVALESVLLSPHFLFRMESLPPSEVSGSAHRVSDYELATRLSYFLWATMPDQELFDQAVNSKLREPSVLRAQVVRMLADPKATSLAEDFAAQWFGFRDMRKAEMDIRRFGKFGGLRDSMYKESVAFFDALFRQNGNLLHILDCDYAYVNERLANHYGIGGVKGDEIRRVELTDRRRGGVLGMGSTLVVTSYPTRTSPVLRGKWVLEQLLGTPPPPPPPNIPAVSKDDSIKDGLTLRQRLEKHREDSACASCHARMDPIGFGLENFDGIGEWRDRDNDLPIDNSASLPDGTEFAAPEGLKDALMAQKDLFIRQLVEKMMTYALGRAVDSYDELTIRQTMDRLKDSDYRAHELIFAIVDSFAFQHRRSSE